MRLHVSGVTRPSSGGSAQLLFGVTACVACVDCVQAAVHRNLHAVNTRPTHVITPNSIRAEPPEDGRVTPKHAEVLTLNKQTKKSV
jgi:hypothetical protein